MGQAVRDGAAAFPDVETGALTSSLDEPAELIAEARRGDGRGLPDATEKLLTYAKDLVHLHLGQAVDCCVIAKRYSDASNGGRRPLQHRYAIASVIYGYAALEGIANRLRFDLFENRDSTSYRELSLEPIAVKRMMSDWRDRVKLEDKLAFLLERKSKVLDGRLRARLADVRGLRNLVAHGWIVETIHEFHRSEDGFVTLKDSISEYKSQFSTLKFSPPDELTFVDAQQALLAVLEAATQVLTAHTLNTPIMLYEPDGAECIGLGEVHDTVAAIMQRIDASPTRPQ